MIYFRHANVMHVGDVPSSLRYPNIGVNDGGSVDGMIAAYLASPSPSAQANSRSSSVPGLAFR
jgi:hypothetical protein